jgi:hypothetical protein
MTRTKITTSRIAAEDVARGDILRSVATGWDARVVFANGTKGGGINVESAATPGRGPVTCLASASVTDGEWVLVSGTV